MPELPEVEVTARLLQAQIVGAQIESVLVPGINALKTFDPPLDALRGSAVLAVRRRGKHLILDADSGLSLLMHLMSAGRLQLYDKLASPRDRTSRVLVRLRSQPPDDGAQEWELRLREFGSRQAAWVKLLRAEDLDQDESLARLGPEAWPQVPPLEKLLDVPRPLNALLRDQHTIAGIGRSWADEILWEARLSPYKRGVDLDGDETAALNESISGTLGGAIAHYEKVLKLPIPDKLPMPLRIHGHAGEACPRCGQTLLAVHFEQHVIAYCPGCQTGGKALKDRRLSRLLK